MSTTINKEQTKDQLKKIEARLGRQRTFILKKNYRRSGTVNFTDNEASEKIIEHTTNHLSREPIMPEKLVDDLFGRIQGDCF